ncbi:MAG: hypothetical protein JST92_22555 [Deltaproteobacteria bacterium]|nr:hypothetical protein [Deltaproteobacteria bacterium]
MRTHLHLTAAALLALSTLTACGGDLTDDSGDETMDQEGKFLTTNAAGKPGLPVSVEGSSTQVWTVTARWSDTNTTAANLAGLAWGANSGLRWDQKFSKWVASMPLVQIEDGSTTFQLTTPYGKTIRMPVLECSETMLLLRAVFASWYGLPFIIEGGDSSGRVYLGHFGFRNAAGRYKGTPNFKTAYADYSARGSSALSNWPHDTALRAKHLTDSDGNDWLGTNAGFGAWADEALLNKRTAWFLVYLLDWFGSMNLADASNAYHLVPTALQTGDMLLERWQKVGIGHTLVLKTVTPLPAGQFAVELVSGSMPRRNPLWADSAWARSYFLSDITGGVGTDDDGNPYAKLGGGLRRFRVAQQVNGKWVNNVPTWDVANAISDSDLATIAARPAQFQTLLADVSPQQKLTLLVNQIEQARGSLRQHPASCSNRTLREGYFGELVALAADQWGWDKATTDRKYRKAEDYLFPELDYSASPTCCWDSTTPAMYDIVLKYNTARQQQSSQCLAPVPFEKANYPAFKAYAAQLGRSADWKDWTQDEACPQAGNATDRESAHAETAWCSVRDVVHF